ncbi:thiamine pyrophosphate-binding protein [Micromonospora sp. WMMD558]|uniref:thiamine pyrophosphate-binding protein n=1 Tax=unclassified Micromonospora TaxID=2617518 RepID=UPI0012B475CB|nr:thiamine pyrophosphate-binding protein [Micromonospora sp. WMMC415]QGN49196.1 thiamine pyrophosphate-binding protein [Micromonospora sp. WMMC415]
MNVDQPDLRPPTHQLDPDAAVREFLDCGITHVVTVPDYVMLSVYRALEANPAHPQLIYTCTEDEAVTMAAGLHIGGARPMVMMQNQGLYASLNAIRAVGIDARLPLFMMIGQFGREYANLGRPPQESARPLVRNCERILDALDIPYFPCERPEDVGNLSKAYRLSHERQWPSAALVGTYTAWPGSATSDHNGAGGTPDTAQVHDAKR